MSLLKNAERIKKIDRRIRMRATGTPLELAQTIGVSRSRLYQLLNEMKALGAPLEYDRESQTYFYHGEGGFQIGFQDEEEGNDPLRNSARELRLPYTQPWSGQDPHNN